MVAVTCAYCYMSFVGTQQQARLSWAACPDCAEAMRTHNQRKARMAI